MLVAYKNGILFVWDEILNPGYTIGSNLVKLIFGSKEDDWVFVELLELSFYFF